MKQNKIILEADGISKRFTGPFLFRNISFSLETGQSMFITGPNGSGKSTLLQITAGLQTPSSGRITFHKDGLPLRDSFRNMIGFTGPQINPYDMLTPEENIKFVSAGKSDEEIACYLEKFSLYSHRSKQVKYFSSGMKQRLRIILSVINEPSILMLDEPGSNLDSSGRDILYSLIEELREKIILIIATNEKDETDLCRGGLDLG